MILIDKAVLKDTLNKREYLININQTGDLTMSLANKMVKFFNEDISKNPTIIQSLLLAQLMAAIHLGIEIGIALDERSAIFILNNEELEQNV